MKVVGSTHRKSWPGVVKALGQIKRLIKQQKLPQSSVVVTPGCNYWKIVWSYQTPEPKDETILQVDDSPRNLVLDF
jgi:hypothetical protein